MDTWSVNKTERGMLINAGSLAMFLPWNLQGIVKFGVDFDNNNTLLVEHGGTVHPLARADSKENAKISVRTMAEAWATGYPSQTAQRCGTPVSFNGPG